MWRKPEEGVFPVLEELGTGFIPYSPLCRGYLAGMLNEQTKFYALNDNKAGLPRYTPESMKMNRPILEALIDFVHPRGLTPAQVALSWLLDKKTWFVPIPGTTKQAHMDEDLSTAELQFAKGELKELESTIAKIKIYGDRYTPGEQKRVE